MDSNLIKELNTEFEHKKARSEEKRAELIELLYKKYPAIRNIQDEISRAGIKYSKDLLLARNDPEAASKLRDIFSRQMEILSAQKTALYNDAGIDPNFADNCYDCRKCNDIGFIITKSGLKEECTCYKMRKLSLLYSCSNFPQLDNQVFSSFDPTLYSDETDETKYRIKVSPRQNIINIKKVCEEFVEEFNNPNGKNLFFSGSSGLGKTFISGCIANELIRMGYSVLYLSASAMFDIMNEHKIVQFSNKDYDDFKYRYIFDCNLLIIDDLGTEAVSESRYSSLLRIIDTRMSSDNYIRKTIISSNIKISKLYEYYTERVASRIIGNFDILSFVGEDIRIKTKLNIK